MIQNYINILKDIKEFITNGLVIEEKIADTNTINHPYLYI